MRGIQHIITSGLGSPPRIIMQGYNPVNNNIPLPEIDNTLILQGFSVTPNQLIGLGYLGSSLNKNIYFFFSRITTEYEFDSYVVKKDGITTLYDQWI